MVIDPLLDFAKDSQMLINACEKPGKKGTFYSSCRNTVDETKTPHPRQQNFLKLQWQLELDFVSWDSLDFL